jgi:serine/threonine-protein kinase
MGVVYRARHAMLRRRTAVKLLSATRTSAHAAARFEREAQLCCQLTHPHTVTIYDYGRTPAGVFYYAMELLDGMDVEQLVAQAGPLPAERAVSLLIAACEALREAHCLGLIHRDIKPSNLFVCRQYGGIADFVKVLDFGLAKIQPASWLATVAALEASLPETNEDKSSRPSLSLPDRASKPSIRTRLAPKSPPSMLANLSADGAVLGTPNYTAPEILRGDSATESSDIYALGAVAYFMLTARTVFGSLATLEVFAAHLHSTPEAPSVHRLTPLPHDLEELILRCLAKSPADRPSSVDDIITALCRVTVSLPAWTSRDAEAWWSCHAPAPASSLRIPQSMLPLREDVPENATHRSNRRSTSSR